MVASSVGFLAALFLGSLTEYWVHRLMHAGVVLGRKHAGHHRNASGQGALREIVEYYVGTLPISGIGFAVAYLGLGSAAGGIGFASGCLAYAILAGWAHQVQHERPELAFWMPRPVHHLHHAHKMWHHNFGILLDVWDRVFGTYKAVDWKPEPRQEPAAGQGRLRLFGIKIY